MGVCSAGMTVRTCPPCLTREFSPRQKHLKLALLLCVTIGCKQAASAEGASHSPPSSSPHVSQTLLQHRLYFEMKDSVFYFYFCVCVGYSHESTVAMVAGAVRSSGSGQLWAAWCGKLWSSAREVFPAQFLWFCFPGFITPDCKFTLQIQVDAT